MKASFHKPSNNSFVAGQDVEVPDQVLFLHYWVSVIFSTWPPPVAVGLNPQLDTYRLPSGPMVMPVGRDNPVAITVILPDGSTSSTLPLPGVGKGAPAVISSTYIPSR